MLVLAVETDEQDLARARYIGAQRFHEFLLCPRGCEFPPAVLAADCKDVKRKVTKSFSVRQPRLFPQPCRYLTKVELANAVNRDQARTVFAEKRDFATGAIAGKVKGDSAVLNGFDDDTFPLSAYGSTRSLITERTSETWPRSFSFAQEHAQHPAKARSLPSSLARISKQR